MADMVRLAIERNLANAERVGDVDRVKKLKARLTQHDKAEKAVAVVEGSGVTSPVATLSQPVTTPKPTVKKAAKKSAGKKK